MRNFILAFALISCISCVTTEQVENDATNNAISWCADMGLNCSGVSCGGVDSDSNGYVSCTVSDNGNRIPIECGHNKPLAFFGQNTSCREVRAFNFSGGDSQ